jgi:adenylate cyclase
MDPAEKDRQKLAILLEVSKGLTRAADVDSLLKKVSDFSFEILEADRCAILLLDDRNNLLTKIARDKRGADQAQAVPQSIARMAIDEKSAIVSENAGEDTRFTGQSILMQRVRSAMCVPLIGSENKVLGVLYVDNFMSSHQFGDADVDFAIAFAGIAAVAIENGQFSDRIRQQALVRSNFERFFTPHLAARIANSADAVKLGGDKRRVAVLFSDIRGFTALSETINPYDMARLLTEYFSEMVECVFRHAGTLDKFIGDAVMAQWGAPLGETDDADRAMSAAMDMMEALDKLNEHWRNQNRPTLEIGIGLNIGDAFAGNIGSERRLEYTVIGDTVNTASRLCGVAAPGEILISDDFKKALVTPPRTAPMPPMELKGKSQPVPVFKVVR